MKITRLTRSTLGIGTLILLALAYRTEAATSTLGWDAPTHNTDGTPITNALGYTVAYGAAAGTYGTPTDVGVSTSHTVEGLTDGQVYYAAVKAYNDLGEVSDFSGELSWTAPDQTPPTLDAPATINLIGDENDQATIPDLSSQVAATDNISDAADLTITQTPVAGGTIELGDTPVTVTAVDEAGNEAEVVVVVSVSPMNRPPQIDAGLAQSIRLPHKSVTLSGTATDDGLPEGGALTVEWTLASGPASVSFTDASSLGTKVTFTEAGTYVLLLTVTDGDLTVTDEVTITVTPKPRPLPPGNLHVRLIE